MAAPRLEIDLDKIYHNAYELVNRLSERGISVTGVTKAALGSIEVAKTLLEAGVISLGDSRIENIESMRLGGKGILANNTPMLLIRSPMLSQLEKVVRHAGMSCNTEIGIIRKLSVDAHRQGLIHQILLMVELGDLREGIMPDDLLETVSEVLSLPNIQLKGIGTNLACRSGIVPDVANMAKLSELANLIETTFDLTLDMISGGNSANIQWALNGKNTEIGRINNLRLGEAIILGCEPLQRQSIGGLYTDAITLVAEVIESKLKPSKPSGSIAQSAFGETLLSTDNLSTDRGVVKQAILAVGVQDIDPSGLQTPMEIEILGASSDHLVVESVKGDLIIGQEVIFQLNYSALLRAMTSPFVSKIYTTRQNPSIAITY